MSAANDLPVTVVISRTPAPGKEDELVAWANGVQQAASSFPGHLGAQIYPPSASDCNDLVMAFSFASAETLSAWEHSDVRRDWLKRAETLIVGEARTHAASGFESIFSHAPGHKVTPPPRWKTALIIAMALYPISLLINWLISPHVAEWNILLRVLVTTAIVVPYMAWVGVPYLSRWLRRWLHR